MELIDYYSEIRTALFLSSMTLGTFIFTMKSFIVQVMKKEIYDKKEYQDSIKQIQETGKNVSCYKPLRNLSRILTQTIVLSFIAAGLHISLGVLDRDWTAQLCIGITLVSWVLVATSIFLVSRNLRKMIDISEGEFEGQNKDNTENS